ncbi:MAG: tRNA preQ1(34) S-adenosylmethionine ribosyltransferase-isomerase QueA [Candidatus Omnitrophota bacterium]|jgi:S-adenosylmethionine:tRNA ribosyltransferase-isomerase
MRLSDLDYSLPKAKIALFPAEDRPAAKLLCVDKKTGKCTHRVFRDLPELLKPTDLLVLNNTKVLRARLFGRRATGGKVEALLLKDLGNNVWEALLKPGGRVGDGSVLAFSQNGMTLEAEVLNNPVPDTGKRLLLFRGTDIKGKLNALGHIPLPPYINRPDQPADCENYQTVFAKEEGAVAAPTAGLHFDKILLEKLTRIGVEIVDVTLHVSYGTFQPITVEHVEGHKMFEEEFEISVETAHKINTAKHAGRRVIVCGTTCVRALESSVNREGELIAQNGKTSIFIYPPYHFRIVDGLVTNFHMPKSTLLAMVSAFLGYEKLMAAYNTALNLDYRFASYGDAMLIS